MFNPFSYPDMQPLSDVPGGYISLKLHKTIMSVTLIER